MAVFVCIALLSTLTCQHPFSDNRDFVPHVLYHFWPDEVFFTNFIPI